MSVKVYLDQTGSKTELSKLPCSFSPNEIKTIQVGNKNSRRPIHLLFFGQFEDHLFTSDDLTKEKINRIVCIHDAPHSVALFLQEKDKCDIALHSFIPFSFPNTLDYTLSFTQKFNYPTLILVNGTPVEKLLQVNGVPKFCARWCARIYKIEMARFTYKHFGLAGITQVKGMTRHQSTRRNKLDPNNNIDPMTQKKFPLFQELPIFEMLEEEQLKLMNKHDIPTSEYYDKYNMHGCLWCPFRSEDYYLQLKEKDRELYDQCHEFRIAGSYRRPEEPYFFYRKSKVM